MPSKDTVAHRLATGHRELDPGITRIHLLVAPGQENNPQEPIKLLEVNQHTTASGIMPVYFTPHPAAGIAYASIIVELHPTEWEQLERGQLSLPNGWQLDRQL